MLRTISLAFVLSLVAAGPALARRCPMEVSAIDKALPTAHLSAAEKKKVMELRNQGDAAHKAGNHPESERILDEANRMLKY